MVVGIGTDIVAVARIHAALTHPRTGSRFRTKIYTADEVAYCMRRRIPWESFAARFAAKEAVMKALGQKVPWTDIAVRRHQDAAPTLQLQQHAHRCAMALGVARLHLSLSHTKEYATAYVLFES